MNKNLEDYILIVENCISDKFANGLINKYHNSEKFSDAQIINSTNGIVLDTEIRNCKEINFTSSEYLIENGEMHNIDEELFSCAKKAIKHYSENFGVTGITRDNGYALLRYKPGDFYSEHTDSFTQTFRTVSCSFALNDDYTGGEWSFFNGNKTFKVPKGSAVLFPSNFMFPHQILPVTSGTRYSIVTWFV